MRWRTPIVDLMFIIAMVLLIIKQEWFGIAYLSIPYAVYNMLAKFSIYKEMNSGVFNS